MTPARARRAAALALAAWLACACDAAAAAPPDAPSPPGTPERVPHTLRTLVVPGVRPAWRAFALDRRDLAYAAAASGLVAIAWHNDVAWSRHATAGDTPARVKVADFVQPLGYHAVYTAGALAWGAAWWAGRPGLLHAVQRADLSVLAAALVTSAIKETGRRRPEDSPDDATVFDPFSRHDAFPSGHATVAFATAAALDRETQSPWVPAIAYPVAGLVAWSRVHDRRHWTSDVLAGAAVGFGVAWKTEDALQAGSGASRSTGARLELGTGDGALAALRVRF